MNYQLMYEIRWILNVLCRKEIFAVLQTKRSLVRREEEKNWKFLHSVNHVFQISKFSSQFKVTTLSNINTISKKKVVLPFKLTIFFIWQHEPISLVKLHYKIGNHFYPLPWNLDFSPPEKKKKIKKYIYIALVSFQSTGNILQPKWCLRGKNCKRRYVTNTSYF